MDVFIKIKFSNFHLIINFEYLIPMVSFLTFLVVLFAGCELFDLWHIFFGSFL